MSSPAKMTGEEEELVCATLFYAVPGLGTDELSTELLAFAIAFF